MMSVCVYGALCQNQLDGGGGGCGREGGGGYSLSCVLDLAAETSPTRGALILSDVYITVITEQFNVNGIKC